MDLDPPSTSVGSKIPQEGQARPSAVTREEKSTRLRFSFKRAQWVVRGAEIVGAGGAGIAFGASILVAWVLGFDWPIASEIVQTLAIVGLIVGIVVFLAHMHGRGSPGHFIPASVQPELADMRHDMRDLYEDGHVGEKIRGALFGLRKETDVFVEHP